MHLSAAFLGVFAPLCFFVGLGNPHPTQALNATNFLTRDLPPAPPMDRKMIDQIYQNNLPECYRKCMKDKNGKSSTNLNDLTVQEFCNLPKWVMVCWWIDYEIAPCTREACEDDTGRAARDWMLSTCGK